MDVVTLFLSLALVMPQGGPPGYIEYSNYPAMLYAMTSPSAMGPFAGGSHFQEKGWITDFDQWFQQSPPNAISVFENYGTVYGVDILSGSLNSEVTPNPSVSRPSSGKNEFTFFVVAKSFPGETDIVFVDRFLAKDTAGSTGGNGTRDPDGTVMSIEVTVKPIPPSGTGGGGT